MAQRSRYPAIPLPEAVERVERIYEQEGPNAMSSKVAVQHMGYGGLNGASLTVLAALKKYGLLEGRGEDLRVSKAGVVILSDKKAEDQTERAEAIRSAFLSDPLFRELDERFSGKTTEINVTSYLQKKGFAPNAAKSAAKSYMESAAFVTSEVGAYNLPTISLSDGTPMLQSRGTTPESKQPSTPLSRGLDSDLRDAPIVISGVSKWPLLQLPKQFTSKNWDDMMRMLAAMKDGLITEDSAKLSPDNGES